MRVLSMVCCFFILTGSLSFAEWDIKVTNFSAGRISPLIFGSNMIGYDPSTYENWGKDYYGYSNFGAGAWNPKIGLPVPEVIQLARDIKIRILRFPGGNGSWYYNWKNTIGSTEKRKKFLYGLDEFLRTCEAIGAEAVFTLPYFSMNKNDAADLVEYLNGKNDGRNRNGGIDWARERAKNGHPKPYRVKYFELGNEVFYGVAKTSIPPVNPETYGKDYVDYQSAMKAVDPAICLGAVTSSVGRGLSPWNDKLFHVAGSRIDFLIEHTYRPNFEFNYEQVDANLLFAHTLRTLGKVDNYYKKLSEHFKRVTGRANIPVAVTEFNAGFVQEKPVPYRHSLGAALFNAGLLQILIKPENNVLFANYWNFVNSYTGMIKNDQFMNLGGSFTKRPNYYVFELFSQHFGRNLLRVETKGPNILPANETNILKNIPWTTKWTPRVKTSMQGDTVQVSFDVSGNTNFYHVLKKVRINPTSTYLVSGYIKAEDLSGMEGVCLEVQDGRGWKQTHSAASTPRVWGTTDWVRVSAEYVPLKDTKEVSVMIRRNGGGPIHGKALVRDVSLIEQREIELSQHEALSVSATKNDMKNTIYIMVLNKDVYSDIKTKISIPLINNKLIDIWTLNSDDISSTNEIIPNKVTINHTIVKKAKGTSFYYTFPAHSLTSLELRR